MVCTRTYTIKNSNVQHIFYVWSAQQCRDSATSCLTFDCHRCIFSSVGLISVAKISLRYFCFITIVRFLFEIIVCLEWRPRWCRASISWTRQAVWNAHGGIKAPQAIVLRIKRLLVGIMHYLRGRHMCHVNDDGLARPKQGLIAGDLGCCLRPFKCSTRRYGDHT